MKKKLDRKKRLGLLGFLLVLLFVSASFLVFSFTRPVFKEEELPWFTYRQQAEVNYRVYLRPNNFFSEKSVGSGESYLANFVDHINTYFTYTFKGNRVANLKGDYNVTGTVRAYLNKDTIAWKKDYILLPQTSFNKKDDILSLKREIPINFNQFVDFVNRLNEEAELMPSVVELVLNWNVNINAVTEKGHVKERLSPSMIIPLSKKSFQIGGELIKEKPGELTVKRQVEDPRVKKLKIFSIAATVFFAVLLVLLLIMSENKTVMNPAQQKVDLILRKYGDRVAFIDGEIQEDEGEVISVRTMEDLIKIADEVDKPVLYRPLPNDEPGVPIFYILDEPLIFKYTLR